MHQSGVRPGKEILPAGAGWLFLRVCTGSGYLLGGPEPCEIETGDMVVIPPAAANIRLRASQLDDLRLCHFGLRAEQLSGFFTAAEQQLLRMAARTGIHGARVVRNPGNGIPDAGLCELQFCRPAALARSEMLTLAVRVLHDLLAETPPPAAMGPERKFAELTARMTESELLALSAEDLARKCGCTGRHFRRLFAGHFGTSLKRRQIEWRLEQSKKLLLETDAKVIEIANQCGFRSLGQFNLFFKRATEMTPSAWRKRFVAAHVKYNRRHPVLCPRQRRQLTTRAG